jgi:hypothetical protein
MKDASGKAKNDRIDSAKIARLSRGGPLVAFGLLENTLRCAGFPRNQ